MHHFLTDIWTLDSDPCIARTAPTSPIAPTADVFWPAFRSANDQLALLSPSKRLRMIVTQRLWPIFADVRLRYRDSTASKIAGLLADIDHHLPDDYAPNSYMVCPGCFTMAYRDEYLVSRIAHKYACGCGRTWYFGVERRRTACTAYRKRRMCSVVGDNKTCGEYAQDMDNVIAHYVGDNRCEVCGKDKSVRWVNCLKRDCEVCLCQTCAEGKPDDYELDFGEDGSLSAYHLSSMEYARLMADCDSKKETRMKSRRPTMKEGNDR